MTKQSIVVTMRKFDSVVCRSAWDRGQLAAFRRIDRGRVATTAAIARPGVATARVDLRPQPAANSTSARRMGPV